MTFVDIMEKASQGLYGDESELIGKMAGLLQASQFDRTWGPFICGTLGQVGSDGLHDGYMICPAFGVDVAMTQCFLRKK